MDPRLKLWTGTWSDSTSNVSDSISLYRDYVIICGVSLASHGRLLTRHSPAVRHLRNAVVVPLEPRETHLRHGTMYRQEDGCARPHLFSSLGHSIAREDFWETKSCRYWSIYQTSVLLPPGQLITIAC